MSAFADGVVHEAAESAELADAVEDGYIRAHLRRLLSLLPKPHQVGVAASTLLLGALSLFAASPAEAHHKNETPLNFSAAATGQGEVTLLWRRGTTRFVSQGYRIEYRLISPTLGTIEHRNVARNRKLRQSEMITGLELFPGGTRYSFRVRANGFQQHTASDWSRWVSVDFNAYNANLSELTASSASGTAYTPLTLTPATFNPAITNYSATVESGIANVRVTPTAAQANATIRVGRAGGVLFPVASGQSSAAVPLADGTNRILIVVTAQDTTTTKTYRVTITRTTGTSTPWHDYWTDYGDDVWSATLTAGHPVDIVTTHTDTSIVVNTYWYRKQCSSKPCPISYGKREAVSTTTTTYTNPNRKILGCNAHARRGTPGYDTTNCTSRSVLTGNAFRYHDTPTK